MERLDWDVVIQSYLPKLIRLAARKLESSKNSLVEPEDVVSSVFRTVFRRLKSGKLELDDDDSIWNVLVTVLVRRLQNKIRHENAAKRSINKTVELEEFLTLVFSRDPDPQDAVHFNQIIEDVCKHLNPESRNVFELKIAGYNNFEIADKLNISPRTVGRRIALIRDILEQVN